MFSVTGKLLVKPRVCRAPCPLILRGELPAKLKPDGLAEGHSLCCSCIFHPHHVEGVPRHTKQNTRQSGGTDKVADSRVVNEG